MAVSAQRRLARESRSVRAHLLAAAALGLVSAVLIVAQAALLAAVIARSAQGHESLARLQPRLIALAAVLLARALLSGAFELSGRLGAVRAMSQLRGRLAERLLVACPGGLPSGWRTGELATAAVQGVDALEAWFAGYLPQLVLATVVPLAVLAYAATLDPIVAGVLAITVPLLIVFMVLVGKGARERANARYAALSLLGSHFLDVVRGLPTLIVHRRERAQQDTLAAVGERYRAETMATLRVAFLSALVLELCAMIGTALAAATIGVQLVSGALSLQAGLTVLLLAPELYGPLRSLGAQFHAGADSASAAERIYAALDLPATISVEASRTSAPDPAVNAIRLEGVAYEYPDRAGRALDGLDIELRPGELTALVGPSGAGKSTIAKLLLRLADPSEGRVSCGGIDLRELDAEVWRERIAWVPQRAHLFAGSVAENLRVACPSASDEQLLAALHDAGADELLAELPRGIATRLGEGGRRLSAGQRQRIALARAFLRPASLLVFDEPTSHLDEDSAARVVAKIARLARERTALLIVHHPDLATAASHVVRMRPVPVSA